MQEYKRYYCSTCKALEYNYGHLSKALLSYDVALITMFMGLNIKGSKVHKLRCLLYCGSFKCVRNNIEWKGIAAFSLLIFAGKLKDDVLDESSKKAKLLLQIYRKVIKRATNDFPEMARIIDEGLERIHKNEKLGADSFTISRDFSEMMWSSISCCIDITNQQKEFIITISEWVYLIDALNDYDEDVIKNRFNPFVEYGLNFKEYLAFHRQNILKRVEVSCADCLTYNDERFNYSAAEIILYQFIPDVTQKILNGDSLKMIKIKSKCINCDLLSCSSGEENIL
jgi:hypothetical protein